MSPTSPLFSSPETHIPKSFAAELHLDHGSKVHLTPVNGQLVVTPVPAPTFALSQLLEVVTDQNLHHEINTGDAAGQEAW